MHVFVEFKVNIFRQFSYYMPFSARGFGEEADLYKCNIVILHRLLSSANAEIIRKNVIKRRKSLYNFEN